MSVPPVPLLCHADRSKSADELYAGQLSPSRTTSGDPLCPLLIIAVNTLHVVHDVIDERSQVEFATAWANRPVLG